jgi:hypothetical protein
LKKVVISIYTTEKHIWCGNYVAQFSILTGQFQNNGWDFSQLVNVCFSNGMEFKSVLKGKCVCVSLENRSQIFYCLKIESVCLKERSF